MVANGEPSSGRAAESSARGKVGGLAAFNIRSKSSSSSLRFRSQPAAITTSTTTSSSAAANHGAAAATTAAHTKQKPSVASSTWRGIRAKDGALSSSTSSRDLHSSSSSLSLDGLDDELDRPTGDAGKRKAQGGLTVGGRLSTDRAPSSDRLSVDRRRPLDHSPASSTRNLLAPPSSSTSTAPTAGPTPPVAPATSNKMHQTSSRLLRMTDEERPFTRDFKDLFSTLMVSLPLTPHRVRFQKIDHTFTSEEAINNLGSLKFSQSNRMPDPKDPSRIVTTTTTTTFSMAKEMARSVCQRFMDARFVEPADGRAAAAFPLKGAVWQLTPKGIYILQMFCQRNGIAQRHVLDVLDSPRNTMQLVMLERDPASDRLSHDKATVEVLFRRFVGQDGPNNAARPTSGGLPGGGGVGGGGGGGAAHAPNGHSHGGHGGSGSSGSDADSVHEEYNGVVGVRMAAERRVLDRVVPNTFTGRAAVDWLMDCCTTVERRETVELAELFVQHGLVWAALEDKVFVHQNPGMARFQPTKNAVYGVTEKGRRVAGWTSRAGTPEADEKGATGAAAAGKASGAGKSEVEKAGATTGAAASATSAAATPPAAAAAPRSTRDSNNNRLLVIVNDPALRLLFREFLRDTHCEENLAFFLEVREFTKHYDISDRAKMFTRLDAIRESLAAAYGLYNAFLAPGSPCELNIDHNLRNSLAGRMTRAVGDDESMLKSLQDVVALFKEAQTSVFKLMSSDSVPKFLKEPRYQNVLREHNFDHVVANGAHHAPSASLPERTLSRTTARAS